MAQCLILKSFKGSQDGRHTVQFNEGDVADLSDYLMNCAVQTDFRRIDQPAAAPTPENKAVITNKSRTDRK